MQRSIKVFHRQSDGFSLVELLVSIVVASIFSAVILTVFISGTKSFSATGIISEIRSEADASIGQILSEITGFDAIRIDEENRISFYEKSLPSLNFNTGLLERSTSFIPYTSMNQHGIESNTEATHFVFDETSSNGSILMYEQKIEPVNDQITMKKTFTISNPEYVVVKDGLNPGRYVIHGILTIRLDIQSNDEEEQQTLTSTIGF